MSTLLFKCFFSSSSSRAISLLDAVGRCSCTCVTWYDGMMCTYYMCFLVGQSPQHNCEANVRSIPGSGGGENGRQ